MSLGPVMIDLEGLEISSVEREMLQHPLVGGVILFTRNYDSPEQITELIEAIHRIRTPHLLVAVDHEGGRVQRFREGFTRLPPVGKLALRYQQDKKVAKKLAETLGWLMAVELRSVGVDFSFAPVLDVDRGISDIIGDRSFGNDSETVSSLAVAYIRGMHKAGMVATGKHFPGHGAIKADSHIACPVDERSFEDIYAEDIVPFARVINNGLAGIMPAHVVYSSVDVSPAGFSSFWLNQVLRNQLEFQGVIFSDDLSMEGAKVAGDIVDRAKAALKAGCDMVLVCNDPGSARRVLDNLGECNDPIAHVRFARMHGRHFVNRQQLLKATEWKHAVATIEGLSAGDSLELGK
ncbi:MAG: beta-N-acetylhexosaminidase [Gammaproteobacteria bacterium]|nr:beta-N-acetylhexosaminidase [Gammaproteobacteria bacterium]